MTSISLPALEGIMFLWLASFMLAAFINGLANIKSALGVVMIFVIFVLGMTSGYLPPEGPPSFWANFIYPWVFEHFIGDGIRQVAYMGAGAWNNACAPLVIYGVIGIVVGLISLAILSKGKKTEKAAAWQKADT